MSIALFLKTVVYYLRFLLPFDFLLEVDGPDGPDGPEGPAGTLFSNPSYNPIYLKPFTMANRRISVIKIVHILLLNNTSINIVYTINKYDKLFTAFTTITMRRPLYTVNHTCL